MATLSAEVGAAVAVSMSRRCPGFDGPGGGAGPVSAARWHTPEHAGRARLIAVPGRLGREAMTGGTPAEHDRVRKYFRGHVGRMDDPEHLRRGGRIASGAVESGCKPAVNQRPCPGGTRRGGAGADAVAHLRPPYRTDPDPWNAFWAPAS